MTPVLPTLLLIAAAGGAASLEKAVDTVIGNLDLTKVEGFDIHADVALAIDLGAAADGEALRPIVHGLARAELERTGLTHLIDIRTNRAFHDAARRAGGEWLILIAGDRTTQGDLRLFASLSVVDRGLWSPVPDDDATAIYAIAEHTIAVPTTIAPPPPPPLPTTETTSTPTLRGPAVRVTKIPGRVVAMAVCPLADGAVLAVLTRDALLVYGHTKRFGQLHSMPLAGRPRAVVPVRDAIGSVVCGRTPGVIAFGHSSYAGGVVIEVVRRGAGLRVVLRRELDQIPLVALDDGAWLLGRPDAGTNRYEPRLVDSSTKEALEVPPTYTIATAASVWFAVDTEDRLIAGGNGLRSSTPVGRSGGALATWRGLLFHTAPTLADGQDIVSIYSTEYKPSSITVDCPAHALAVGGLTEAATNVWIAARAPNETDTTLLSARLDGVEAPE